MRSITLLSLLALCACAPAMPSNDGGSDASGPATDASGDGAVAQCATVTDAPAPTALFMGGYSATSDVSAESAIVSAINAARTAAGMAAIPWWEMIEPMAGESAPLTLALRRADTLALGSMGASSPDSLEATFRAGLREARAATDDAGRALAKQRVEKPLLTALGVLLQSALSDATAAAQRGCAREALQSWDRGAVYYSGLDANYRSRSTTMITGVWGAGRDTLADENMGDATVALLGRGRTAAMGGSSAGLRAVASELSTYATKYSFLSIVNYGSVVDAARARMATFAKEKLEGSLFADGLVLTVARTPADGQSTASAALRALWRGPDAMITRTAVVRAGVAVYAEALDRDVTAFMTLDREGQLAAASRAVGIVEALDEALAYGRQDATMLRARAAEARSAASTGNTAMAAAALTAVRDAVRTLSTTAGAM